MNYKKSAVILAAGEGKRMKSENPKVLCEVLKKPMIDWVVDSVAQSDIDNICVVIGFGGEKVESHLAGLDHNKGLNLSFAVQDQRLGTGHAVMKAKNFLSEFIDDGDTLVLCGDAPFISPKDILNAYKKHIESGAGATIISSKLKDPTGYGRIVRKNSFVKGIVEEKDSSDEIKSINEVNSGAYWFKTSLLIHALDKIKNNNAGGEYYLTDTISVLIEDGHSVESFTAAPEVILGANSRKNLMDLNILARDRILDRHLENGVEIVVPDGIIIGPNVKIGKETKILPGSILTGDTEIGDNCIIGPNSEIEDCVIGDYSEINSSKCTKSRVGSYVRFGPYSQLRPNCTLADYVKVGDFVEVKNSTLGEKTSIAHLTYVGDSDVGDRVNFGCGCVTVNYDGINKARCTIGNDCFIGCNTNLIAPVNIGDGAYTAAGTTVTRDVPNGALAVGRARQEIKDGWAAAKMSQKKKK